MNGPIDGDDEDAAQKCGEDPGHSADYDCILTAIFEGASVARYASCKQETNEDCNRPESYGRNEKPSLRQLKQIDVHVSPMVGEI
jgi:hypothetical protein